MTMEKEYYSNGKLLITGEYIVLDGANAFALPTKFGQNLIIKQGSNNLIEWKSFDSDGSVWFEDNISFLEISNTKKSEKTDSVRNTLIEILKEAYLLNSSFIDHSEGYSVSTRLTFPRNWGLGTSSTLINNIAQWTKVDAFELLKNSFGGSGYDIACAQNNNPILYHLANRKPIVEKVAFEPEFSKKLYFVYLDKKQNSKSAIASYYKNKKSNLEQTITQINGITKNVLKAKTFEEFTIEIEKHETEMSAILEIETVKKTLFPDFRGSIKSLGAWGGDFVLVLSEENPSDYFKKKGYEVIIPYQEMIL
jgi:mevalonate kinase